MTVHKEVTIYTKKYLFQCALPIYEAFKASRLQDLIAQTTPLPLAQILTFLQVINNMLASD